VFGGFMQEVEVRITDVEWTPRVNLLTVRCECGAQWKHRADRWKVRCPNRVCSRTENLAALRDRWVEEHKQMATVQQVSFQQKLVFLTELVGKHIFNPELKEFTCGKEKLPIHSWKGGACRGVDIGDYRFVTQNPNKPGSKWAKVAQRGGKVMWVIRRSDNAWVARYFNGQVELLR
jgi:hypothetical protein